MASFLEMSSLQAPVLALTFPIRPIPFAVTLVSSLVSPEFKADLSKVKSPKEKKKLSLARDRSNMYGENPKASRKGIRRGKQRRHMQERRAVGHVLRHLKEKS